jgi:hypothetical protein
MWTRQPYTQRAGCINCIQFYVIHWHQLPETIADMTNGENHGIE